MELVKAELSIPKETKEAIDLLGVVAEKIKSGAKYTEYADILDEAFVALDGSGKIPEELKSEHKDDISAYLVKRVGGVFF